MIQLFSRWVQALLSLLLFLALIQLLLPEGRLREYTRLVLGLVVIGAVLTPLMSLLDPDTWEVGLRQALTHLEQRLAPVPTFPATGGFGRPGEAGPWIARGISLAQRAREPIHEGIYALWERQVRSLTLLVPGVDEAEVYTQWDPEGAARQVRIRVWARSEAGEEPAASLARRVRSVISDYFRLPPERVRVDVERAPADVEKRGMEE